MRGILLLAVLSIKSSYSREIGTLLEDADDVPDTLQWWFGDGGCWRVRTYALDHDIHAHQIASTLQTTLELAKKNNDENYGDIIKSQYQIHFVDCASPAEWKQSLDELVWLHGSKLLAVSLHSGSQTKRRIQRNRLPPSAALYSLSV